MSFTALGHGGRRSNFCRADTDREIGPITVCLAACPHAVYRLADNSEVARERQNIFAINRHTHRYPTLLWRLNNILNTLQVHLHFHPRHVCTALHCKHHSYRFAFPIYAYKYLGSQQWVERREIPNPYTIIPWSFSNALSLIIWSLRFFTDVRLVSLSFVLLLRQ
jgi:hypothetical protein